MTAQVLQLNQHPINRAAALMLRKADGEALVPTPVMHALLLAMTQTPEDDLRHAILTDYARTPELQALALDKLDAYLTPEEIREGTPQQAAEQILAVLEPPREAD